MYYYVYDTFLRDRKYEKTIAACESRLNDFGIAGKIKRLLPTTQRVKFMTEQFKTREDTLVAVGNDETIRKVIPLAIEQKVPLGMIPIGPKNRLSKLFGVPEGIDACEVLSARRIAFLDTGKLNDKFFLTSVRLPARGVKLECEDSYAIHPVTSGEFAVYNLMDPFGVATNHVFDPTDGHLDAQFVPRVAWTPRRAMQSLVGSKTAYSQTELAKPTTIKLKKIVASSPRPIIVYIDGMPHQGSELVIEVVPRSIRVVVGKNRAF